MWDCMAPILAKLPRMTLNGSVNGFHAAQTRTGPSEWSTTMSELERYRAYEDDWDGQGAKGISGEVIDAGVALVAFLRSHAIIAPAYVVPGFGGTVGFEWSISGGGSITLEISGAGSADFERYVPGGSFEFLKLGETVPA